MAASIANTEAVTMCDALVDSFDDGAGAATLIIYDDGDTGGSIPARVSAALPGGVIVLAQITLNDPACGGAVDVPGSNLARATALGVPLSDTSADNTGTAYFGRILDSNAVVRFQGECGAVASGKEFELDSVSIQSGATVTLVSAVFDMPEGGS